MCFCKHQIDVKYGWQSSNELVLQFIEGYLEPVLNQNAFCFAKHCDT